MDFGLTVILEWWKWLLMVLGAAFCWGLGTRMGVAFGAALFVWGRRNSGD